MIKWVGPVFDNSGYTQANRDYIKALYQQTKEITVQPFFPFLPHHEINESTKFITELSKNNLSSKFVIYHCVPEEIDKLVHKDKINIGYNTWETSFLPKHWVEKMNKHLDAVFVPSKFNETVYRISGVDIPIDVIPHCFDINEFENIPDIPLQLKHKFKFLSVFQWTERKNPFGLLKAYFSEFKEYDDVILILKTYGRDNSQYEQTQILNQIEKLKKDMNLKYYPPIYFIGKAMKRHEILTLYKESDCFVLPTRGEGFGMPYAEAALMENHVIASAFGGQVDFLRNDFSTLIDYQLAPVSGMSWIPNYNAHMYWADPNIQHTKKAMRYIYSDKDLLIQSKQKSKEYISKTLNYDVVGKQLFDCILKYEKGE